MSCFPCQVKGHAVCDISNPSCHSRNFNPEDETDLEAKTRGRKKPRKGASGDDFGPGIMQMANTGQLPSQTPLNCPFEGCTRAFYSQTQLNLHIARTTSHKVKCKHPGCVKEFQDQKSLAFHTQTVHDEKKPDKKSRFWCIYCDAIFHRDMELFRHHHQANHPGDPIAWDDGRMKYACPIDSCRKQIPHKRDMLIHIERVHKDNAPKYRCTACPDKKFASKGHFEDHVRTSHKVRGDVRAFMTIIHPPPTVEDVSGITVTSGPAGGQGGGLERERLFAEPESYEYLAERSAPISRRTPYGMAPPPQQQQARFPSIDDGFPRAGSPAPTYTSNNPLQQGTGPTESAYGPRGGEGYGQMTEPYGRPSGHYPSRQQRGQVQDPSFPSSAPPNFTPSDGSYRNPTGYGHPQQQGLPIQDPYLRPNNPAQGHPRQTAAGRTDPSAYVAGGDMPPPEPYPRLVGNDERRTGRTEDTNAQHSRTSDHYLRRDQHSEDSYDDQSSNRREHRADVQRSDNTPEVGELTKRLREAKLVDRNRRPPQPESAETSKEHSRSRSDSRDGGSVRYRTKKYRTPSGDSN